MHAKKPPLFKPDYDPVFLSTTPFFQGLTENEVMEIADRAKVLSRNRSEAFFNQGDAVARQYILLSGEIKIISITLGGEQTAMRYAGPGELFGGQLYECLEEYPVSAIAAKDSRALCWSRSGIQKLLMAYPRLAVNLIHILGLELARIRDRFQELATQRIEQRVARALVRLVDHGGKRVDCGVLIDFPVSRQDLAELTGTTLFSVSRILAKWEKMGILESGRQSICIRNPHGLMVFAEDLDHSIRPQNEIQNANEDKKG